MTPPAETGSPFAGPPWRSARLGWAITLLVLVAGVPLFLCMPPWADVTLYDIAARSVLAGGVHYRDVFDTNLPGVVWMMAAVRSAFGWSYEVLRAFDLLVVGAAAAILAAFARRSGARGAAIAWYAVAVAGWYPFTSEFNHCQRDPWMLLPASVAAWLRLKQIARATSGPTALGRPACREGIVWGLAVWVKPHAILIAAAVWLVSAVLIARAAGWRRLRADVLGLLLGGLLTGAAGTAWLVGTGAWPYFWDIFTTWNPEYMADVWRDIPQRAGDVFWYFRPWSLLHAVAIPVAVFSLREALAGSRPRRLPVALYAAVATPHAAHARAILAALYLAFLGQSVIVQKGFEYAHVPETLLAFAALAGQGWAVGFPYLVWFTVVGVLLNLAAAIPAIRPVVPSPGTGIRVLRVEKHPLADAAIVGLWPRCWHEGGSPELRDRLGHYINAHCGTNWEDLDAVARYLRTVEPPLRDRELTCWHDSTHPLYLILDLDPSTRYMHFGTVFPLRGKVARIQREVAASPQRYVVSDLRRVTYYLREAYAPGAAGPHSLPAWFPRSQRDKYPWDQPVVFRAGRYVVHRVVHPPRADEIDLPDWFHLDELGPGD